MEGAASNPNEIERKPFERGLVQVYTGDGKGKTTAALGLAVRAAGYGLPCHLIQFLKGVPYGELDGLAAIAGIKVRQFGTSDWVHPDRLRQADRQRALEAMAYARAVLAGRYYRVVILDEINLALDWRLLDVERVLDLIQAKPPEVELVLTGRNAPPEIIAVADLVTEMREIKHPYRQGILARGGIEF